MGKIGFCFTGEGARGSIQSGIALGLYNNGIKADYTIGVSSGSICSAAYSYLGAQGLTEMWRDIDNIFSVFSLNFNLANPPLPAISAFSTPSFVIANLRISIFSYSSVL